MSTLFHWSLRTKLLSILLLLLLIPLSSVYVLKTVEQTLVENLKRNLLFSANLLNVQLSSNTEWFNEVQALADENIIAQELFVFPMQEPVFLDGKLTEWQSISSYANRYYHENDLSQSLDVLLGSNQKRLYLSLKVIDDNVIYTGDNIGFASDQLVISYLDNDNFPQRIFISPMSQGEVKVRRFSQQSVINFDAFWLETKTGYNLEIAFPSELKPKRLRVAYFDSDSLNQSEHDTVIATSGIELNPLTWPSKSIDAFVNKIDLMPGQRLWVLDNEGRVLAKQGSLKTEQEQASSGFLLNWLFKQNQQALIDKRHAQTNLSSSIIFSALKGQSMSKIESNSTHNYSVALVAVPINDKNIQSHQAKPVGVLLLEENVAKIQLVQQKSLGVFIDAIALIITLIFILITWYINRVSKRITHLKNAIQQGVDDEGRMDKQFDLRLADGDEISQLNNAFIQMGNKLFEYNDYLEKLASRLSHELRTPIAVVRSSLDNLLINASHQSEVETIERALIGTQRLGEIISRMRQASGVKQAMQTAEFESVDLVEMLKQLVSGFNQSFSHFKFTFECEHEHLMHTVSPDLIAEMLDKLLANAMDFSNHNSAIIISLSFNETSFNKKLCLSVTNQGALIEKKNMRKIFQSLVSIRDNTPQNKRQQNNYQLEQEQEQNKIDVLPKAPNLGLGLYVVKLIANFHGAKVKVENHTKPDRVKFSVIWKNWDC